MKRIMSAALTSGMAIAAAMVSPVPAAALTEQEARACFDAFVLDPRISTCTAAIQSIRCLDLDNDYTRDEQIDACTDASQSANWSRRSMAEIFVNRGTAYQVWDQPDKAIDDYSQAIRIDPTLDAAFYDRGLAYEDKGELNRAIADFSQAIGIEVEFASAFSSLGDAYREKGDLERAIASYNEAIRLGRKQDAAFSPFETYFGRATAYRAKGEFDRAIADYREANRITPDTRVSVNLALTYLAKGNVARALAALDEEIADYAEDPDIYLFRGIINLHSGRLAQALNDLGEAAEQGGGEDGYSLLWLDMAEVRGKRASPLANAAKDAGVTKWPAPVIRFYLGETTYEAVLAAADDRDARTKAARICDTNFFAGELGLRRGAKDDAIRFLRLAASRECGIVLAWAANTELKSLGAAPVEPLAGRPVGNPDYRSNFPRLPIAKKPAPMPEPPPRKWSLPAWKRTLSL